MPLSAARQHSSNRWWNCTGAPEWKRDIRPKVPGAFVELIGHRAGQPDQVVFVALAQDEATYRRMAEMPEQHQFYLRFNEVFTGEPTWEDVEMEWGIRE